MRLIDLLETAGRRALEEQRTDGSLPAGCNGPYRDPETPVRNTSHWLVTFARLHRWTGSPEWRHGARLAAQYLLSPTARPHGFGFHHRDSPGKDRCNGLIGAAWTFEALAEATEVLGDPRFAALGEEVFFQHAFDESRGLWEVLETDGRVLGFDPTFNHQLWFAAAAGLLSGPRRAEITARVVRFLDRCDASLTVLSNGLIYHPIPPLHLARSPRGRVRTRLREWTKRLPVPGIRHRLRAVRTELLRKSIGYHAFNMYAFALLEQRFPSHPLWTSERFGRTVAHLELEGYVTALDGNPYGYPYNPPGFEVPFALWVFRSPSPVQWVELATPWLKRQLVHTLDVRTARLARNNADPRTLTARLYELTRLPDHALAGLLLPQGLVPDRSSFLPESTS